MIQTPPTPYRLPWIKTPINVNTLKSCLNQDLTNLLLTTEDLVNPIEYRITQNKRHYPHIALRYSETPNSKRNLLITLHDTNATNANSPSMDQYA